MGSEPKAPRLSMPGTPGDEAPDADISGIDVNNLDMDREKATRLLRAAMGGARAPVSKLRSGLLARGMLGWIMNRFLEAVVSRKGDQKFPQVAGLLVPVGIIEVQLASERPQRTGRWDEGACARARRRSAAAGTLRTAVSPLPSPAPTPAAAPEYTPSGGHAPEAAGGDLRHRQLGRDRVAHGRPHRQQLQRSVGSLASSACSSRRNRCAHAKRSGRPATLYSRQPARHIP